MQIVEPGISQVSKDYAIKISAPGPHCRNLLHYADCFALLVCAPLPHSALS